MLTWQIKALAKQIHLEKDKKAGNVKEMGDLLEHDPNEDVASAMQRALRATEKSNIKLSKMTPKDLKKLSKLKKMAEEGKKQN